MSIKTTTPRGVRLAIFAAVAHDGYMAKKLGLAEVLQSLHEELADAVERSAEGDIHFPVDEIELTVQVGVTDEGSGSGGAKFWVLQLGAELTHSRETIQTVTIRIGSPVDRRGRTIDISRNLDGEP
jgi:Trypsin-co-occurring domain 2